MKVTRNRIMNNKYSFISSKKIPTKWIYLKEDTISAAIKYPNSISLIFASHKKMGGAYENHEKGQEEFIARRTDLVKRLRPYKGLYGDNRKPFYIMLKGLVIKDGDGDTFGDTGGISSYTKRASYTKRDFICSHAPVAKLYKDPYPHLEERIKTICKQVEKWDTFITGKFGCGYFGNNFEDVEKLFQKYVKNKTVVMAIIDKDEK